QPPSDEGPGESRRAHARDPAVRPSPAGPRRGNGRVKLGPPSVSVVLLTYNRLPLLKTALASALRQSWRRREIIVVDAGSSDGTADFLARRHAGDVELVIVPGNPGLSAMMNAGVRR